MFGGLQPRRVFGASLSHLSHVGALMPRGGEASEAAASGHVLPRQLTQWYVLPVVERTVRTPRRRLNAPLWGLNTPGVSLLEPLRAVRRGGYELLDARISAMRRLRVTRGVYLPADTPMHGIFGSKDVIHSWAIPGLGIKVDCIPGYSSHRRLNLR